MSKQVIKEKEVKLSDNHIKDADVSFEGKTNEELKEVAETLNNQLMQYRTMAVKAEGALEVVIQLLPKEEKDDS